MYSVFSRGQLVVAIVLLSLSSPVFAQNGEASIDALVEQLIELRAEVDELDTTLSRMKEDHRDRMSGLARQQGQLSAERERQNMQVRRLEQDLERQREMIREAGVAGEQLQPVIASVVESLRGHVRASLPFKREERLSELEELHGHLSSESLASARIAGRLWSFMADELRLINESGLYRQRIHLGGQEKLVDVARVGMRQLYFRTDDGDVGYAVNQNDEWTFERAGRTERPLINDYMDALQQQMRTGFFELPRLDQSAESR